MIKTIKIDKIGATLITSLDNKPLLVVSFYSEPNQFGSFTEYRKEIRQYDEESFYFIRQLCNDGFKNLAGFALTGLCEAFNNNYIYGIYFKHIKTL